MKNMSFALTTDQIKNKTKTVTRRNGWKKLKAGDLIQPVLKTMGLKKGEKVQKISDPILVVDVRRETLNEMFNEKDACKKEGFPDWEPHQFITMFCDHDNIYPHELITRIEFEYLDEIIKKRDEAKLEVAALRTALKGFERKIK